MYVLLPGLEIRPNQALTFTTWHQRRHLELKEDRHNDSSRRMGDQTLYSSFKVSPVLPSTEAQKLYLKCHRTSHRAG